MDMIKQSYGELDTCRRIAEDTLSAVFGKDTECEEDADDDDTGNANIRCSSSCPEIVKPLPCFIHSNLIFYNEKDFIDHITEIHYDEQLEESMKYFANFGKCIACKEDFTNRLTDLITHILSKSCMGLIKSFCSESSSQYCQIRRGGSENDSLTSDVGSQESESSIENGLKTGSGGRKEQNGWEESSCCIKCYECQSELRSSFELELHSVEFHLVEEFKKKFDFKEHKCILCGLRFSKSWFQGMKQHLQTCEGPKLHDVKAQHAHGYALRDFREIDSDYWSKRKGRVYKPPKYPRKHSSSHRPYRSRISYRTSRYERRSPRRRFRHRPAWSRSPSRSRKSRSRSRSPESYYRPSKRRGSRSHSRSRSNSRSSTRTPSREGISHKNRRRSWRMRSQKSPIHGADRSKPSFDSSCFNESFETLSRISCRTGRFIKDLETPDTKRTRWDFKENHHTNGRNSKSIRMPQPLIDIDSDTSCVDESENINREILRRLILDVSVASLREETPSQFEVYKLEDLWTNFGLADDNNEDVSDVKGLCEPRKQFQSRQSSDNASAGVFLNNKGHLKNLSVNPPGMNKPITSVSHPEPCRKLSTSLQKEVVRKSAPAPPVISTKYKIKHSTETENVPKVGSRISDPRQKTRFRNRSPPESFNNRGSTHMSRLPFPDTLRAAPPPRPDALRPALPPLPDALRYPPPPLPDTLKSLLPPLPVSPKSPPVPLPNPLKAPPPPLTETHKVPLLPLPDAPKLPLPDAPKLPLPDAPKLPLPDAPKLPLPDTIKALPLKTQNVLLLPLPDAPKLPIPDQVKARHPPLTDGPKLPLSDQVKARPPPLTDTPKLPLPDQVKARPLPLTDAPMLPLPDAPKLPLPDQVKARPPHLPGAPKLPLPDQVKARPPHLPGVPKLPLPDQVKARPPHLPGAPKLPLPDQVKVRPPHLTDAPKLPLPDAPKLPFPDQVKACPPPLPGARKLPLPDQVKARPPPLPDQVKARPLPLPDAPKLPLPDTPKLTLPDQVKAPRLHLTEAHKLPVLAHPDASNLPLLPLKNTLKSISPLKNTLKSSSLPVIAKRPNLLPNCSSGKERLEKLQKPAASVGTAASKTTSSDSHPSMPSSSVKATSTIGPCKTSGLAHFAFNIPKMLHKQAASPKAAEPQVTPTPQPLLVPGERRRTEHLSKKSIDGETTNQLTLKQKPPRSDALNKTKLERKRDRKRMLKLEKLQRKKKSNELQPGQNVRPSQIYKKLLHCVCGKKHETPRVTLDCLHRLGLDICYLCLAVTQNTFESAREHNESAGHFEGGDITELKVRCPFPDCPARKPFDFHRGIKNHLTRKHFPKTGHDQESIQIIYEKIRCGIPFATESSKGVKNERESTLLVRNTT